MLNVLDYFYYLIHIIFWVNNMIYDIDDTRFYEIKDIKEVISHDFMLSFNNKNNCVASYLLEVDLTYLDNNDSERLVRIKLPVELNTTDDEKMEVSVKSLNIDLVANKGINLVFDLSIELEDDVIVDNTPLEAFIDARSIEEVVLEESVERVIKEKSLFDFVKDSYCSYKVINIDMDNIEKISLKYNIPIEKLIKDKNNGGKTIVYDK